MGDGDGANSDDKIKRGVLHKLGETYLVAYVCAETFRQVCLLLLGLFVVKILATYRRGINLQHLVYQRLKMELRLPFVFKVCSRKKKYKTSVAEIKHCKLQRVFNALYYGGTGILTVV